MSTMAGGSGAGDRQLSQEYKCVKTSWRGLNGR